MTNYTNPFRDFANWIDDQIRERNDSYADQEAEIRAEHMMDWVMSGHDPADAALYARYEMDGWPESPMTGELCEHGLDAGLCAGPGHYPAEM